MLRETSVHLGDGLKVEFDGWLYRLFAYRDNGLDEIFMDPDALKKFRAFVDLVEQAEGHVVPKSPRFECRAAVYNFGLISYISGVASWPKN